MIPTPVWVQNAEFGSGKQNSFPLETRHTSTSVPTNLVNVQFEHVFSNVLQKWALIREPQKRTYLLLFPHEYRDNVPNNNNARRYPVEERTNFGLTWQKRKSKLDTMCSSEMKGVRSSLIREDSEVFLLVIPVRFSRVWKETRREFLNQHKNPSDEFLSPDFVAGRSDPLLPLVIGFIAINRVMPSKLDFVCISPYWRGPIGQSRGIGSLLVALFELNNAVAEIHLEALNQAQTVFFYLQRGWNLKEFKHALWINNLLDYATDNLVSENRFEQFRETDGSIPPVIPMFKENKLLIELDQANLLISELEELVSAIGKEAFGFQERLQNLLNKKMDMQ